ncbi:hypothetical protein ATE92_2169 [Ulvibacter sp. MAR_2010_11]|uniref:septum formation inhibitor Maf n=1 Tax=Ulvibacter sp. MAR_2010_11 TaxID=1250229 RepID=UPI000C2C76F8|nr:septum formation inhibitor Maf [Ulvibacter sp. MAR_2010_11]PKA83999.1 hypothetical protein ATE92_2169 [Ulvibacter sp. MAR_2010_11]
MKFLLYNTLVIFLFLTLITSCNSVEKDTDPLGVSNSKKDKREPKPRNLSEEFKAYWYNGTAEITSYDLSQERYGEIREGSAVTIFVTEDFLPSEQVKANNYSEENISVLKLNQMKNFLTGIYPYSIMSSTFSPVKHTGHALKVSNSVQEWCGMVYAQLNNKNDFEIEAYSYFEGEADQSIKLPKAWLENELWNLIRINPEELPTGDISIIPSFEYLRLRHKKLDAYPAFAGLKQGDSLTSYSINYPELQRQLVIYFNSTFPYEIEKWEETNATQPHDTLRLKTTATKMKRIRTSYWTQNSNKDVILRDSLGIK